MKEDIIFKYIYDKYVFVFSLSLYVTINGSKQSAIERNIHTVCTRLDMFKDCEYRLLNILFDDFFDNNTECEDFCKTFFPNAIRIVY